MSVKEETLLQTRIQTLIKQRGGYVRKNHGNMITVKGLADLSFTYRGLSVYWEIKTPKDATNVSTGQGIHCRLAKKAGAITAIISTLKQANTILDLIDKYASSTVPFYKWLEEHKVLHEIGDWDDGTTY